MVKVQTVTAASCLFVQSWHRLNAEARYKNRLRHASRDMKSVPRLWTSHHQPFWPPAEALLTSRITHESGYRYLCQTVPQPLHTYSRMLAMAFLHNPQPLPAKNHVPLPFHSFPCSTFSCLLACPDQSPSSCLVLVVSLLYCP